MDFADAGARGQQPLGTREPTANRFAPTLSPRSSNALLDRSAQPISTSRQTSFWTIVLATYTGAGHAQRADQLTLLVNRLAMDAPVLAGVMVRPARNGSMVIVGRFDHATDADAQAAMKRIKSLALGNRRPFLSAMLSRVRPPSDPRQVHPYELLSLRKRYPQTNPLYTLQVAVWSDFESGKLSLEQIHRSAEAYVRELRTQGFESYVHHDDDLQMSMVTIGVFGAEAVDPETGLFDPEVMRLLRRFPANLVNGEELRELINPRRPQQGSRIQRPQLVEVPRL